MAGNVIFDIGLADRDAMQPYLENVFGTLTAIAAKMSFWTAALDSFDNHYVILCII
jgi:hypothetical protein